MQIALPTLTNGGECHQITNGNDIAWSGEKPWHGLGTKMSEGMSLDQWRKAAGLDFEIHEAVVQYDADGLNPLSSEMRLLDAAKVLYRSDTKEALCVASAKYQTVQPRSCIDFFAEVSASGAMKLETAGSLRGGAIVWALARTGEEFELPGSDVVQGYVMFSTHNDTTGSTKIGDTPIRVVCANTYRMAMGQSAFDVRWSHRVKFDIERAKKMLAECNARFAAFYETAVRLTRIQLDAAQATSALTRIISGNDALTLEERKAITEGSGFKSIMALFDGAGKGANLESAHGTAWGLFNAVTDFADHEKRARSEDNRMVSAWFGAGAKLKDRALEVLTA